MKEEKWISPCKRDVCLKPDICEDVCVMARQITITDLKTAFEAGRSYQRHINDSFETPAATFEGWLVTYVKNTLLKTIKK